MAEYDAIRGVAGARAAEIDAGLRTHMNKVYGTMSIGMLLTFAVAWAVGTSPALLSVFRDPATLQPNILGWIIMFAPLGMVFLFGAAINRLSAAGVDTARRRPDCQIHQVEEMATFLDQRSTGITAEAIPIAHLR